MNSRLKLPCLFVWKWTFFLVWYFYYLVSDSQLGMIICLMYIYRIFGMLTHAGIDFPVWLWNRLLPAGLEPVLISQTEKSCIASNYRQFSTNIKIKIIKLIPVFLSPGLWPLRANKTDFDLILFHFDIRGKLSIIRCDKYILNTNSRIRQNIQVLKNMSKGYNQMQ